MTEINTESLVLLCYAIYSKYSDLLVRSTEDLRSDMLSTIKLIV